MNPLHPVCLWDFVIQTGLGSTIESCMFMRLCGLNRVGAYYWIPYILYVYETFVVQTGVGSTIESHTSCMFMRLLWSKQGWGLLLNPLHPVCLWDFYNSLLLHLLVFLTDPVHGILLDIVIYWYYINLQKSVALIFTVYEIFLTICQCTFNSL